MQLPHPRNVLSLFSKLQALCCTQSSAVSCKDEGGSHCIASEGDRPGDTFAVWGHSTLLGAQVYKRKGKLEHLLFLKYV